VLDGFVARNDSFRLRIDDVQHHIGGYVIYLANYEQIWKYADELGITKEAVYNYKPE